MDNSTRDKVRAALRLGLEHMPFYAASSRAMITEALRLLDAPVAEVPAGISETFAAPFVPDVTDLASILHYPDHWDTAAYPTPESALREALFSIGCNECRAAPQPPVAPVSGWQPIETAPKDRDVLVYVAERDGLFGFQCIACWDESGGWCCDELRETTHWMPLPPAPETPR